MAIIELIHIFWTLKATYKGSTCRSIEKIIIKAILEYVWKDSVIIPKTAWAISLKHQFFCFICLFWVLSEIFNSIFPTNMASENSLVKEFYISDGIVLICTIPIKIYCF